MTNTDPQQVHAIGEKLRAVRQQRQMSLRELAHKADVSASMLSQIETGKVFPSVRSLYTIANALDVSMDYFFPDGNNGRTPVHAAETNSQRAPTASEMRDARVNGTMGIDKEFTAEVQSSTPVVHGDTRPTIELNGGVTWSRLTAVAEKDAEFLEINYAPGAMSGVSLSHHEGREFGLILQGELVVELGFESYTLHEGDSVVFESTVPHRLSNKGSQLMRAVWVVWSK